MPTSAEHIEEALQNAMINSEYNDEEAEQPFDISPNFNKAYAYLGLGILAFLTMSNNINTFKNNTPLPEDHDFYDCCEHFLWFTSSFIMEFLFCMGFFVAYITEITNDVRAPSSRDFNNSHEFFNTTPLNENEWLKVGNEYNFELCFEEIKTRLTTHYGNHADRLINNLEKYFKNRGYVSTLSWEFLSAPICMGSNRYNKEDIYNAIKSELKDSPIFMNRFYTFRNPFGNREEISFQFRNLHIDTVFREIIADEFKKINDCLENNTNISSEELEKELGKILGEKFPTPFCQKEIPESSTDSHSQGSSRLSCLKQ